MSGAFAYLGHVVTPLGYADLTGWAWDDHAAALAAFGRSAPLIGRSDVLGGISPEAWRANAPPEGGLPPDAARAFFEERFQPVLIEDRARSLFTGYFEPVLEGSRVREDIYQTPLYALPPERRRRRRRAPTREQIYEGALDGRELEIVWVADPVEAFFLEIQGSGRISLPDGSMTRVGYAGQNGRRYVAIGRWLLASGITFGVSLVFLYLSSTLYHSLAPPRAKRVFKVLDHAGIYLLIAGSYTPFTLVTLRGPWGWGIFAAIWMLAIVGIAAEAFWVDRPRWLSATVFVGMGWMVVVAFRPLIEALPAGGLWLLLAGGLAYTVGTVFYVLKRVPYMHAVWHLWVIGGSACHVVAVLLYVF